MNTRSPEGQPTWPYQPPAATAHAAPPPKGRKVLKRVGMIGAFFVTFLFGYSVGDQPDVASTSSYSAPAASAPAYDSLPTYEAPAPAAEPEPAPTVNGFAEGDWLVGSEIQPGKYRSPGAKVGFFEFCSASTKSADGDVMEWETANANESILITVSSKAEIFSNSGCEPFVKVNK